MPTPTVMIFPNRISREGLRSFLPEGEYPIAGQASRLQDDVELACSADEVRLVLWDLGAGPGPRASVTELRYRFPGARLVAILAAAADQAAVDAVGAGVDGCVMGDVTALALAHALRFVLDGEVVLPAPLATLVVSGRIPEADAPAPATDKRLSPRELQILRCLPAGDSNKVIAKRLGIAEATVKVHLKSLLRKIGASNRTQAAIWALNNGIGGNADDEACA